MPSLTRWNVSDWSQTSVRLDLNFSNPSYVSNSMEKDYLKIDIKNHMFFQSIKDARTLDEEFEMPLITIPLQAKSVQEYEEIGQTSASVEKTMAVTFVIPLFFLFAV